MDKKNEKIIKDISTGYFAMVKELDLDELFKLTYNFDLLKGLITSILKNQESLKNQLDKEKEKNNEQNIIIENLKNDMEIMQEKYMTKESVKIQINDINNKISKIDEEIKGKFKGKKKSIKYIKKEGEGEENETDENKEEYTFEDNEEEQYKKYINDKFSQIDKKFKIIVGDINLDEEVEEEKEDEDEFNINSNYYKNINSTKSDKSKKAKNFSLSEINQRLNQLNSIKLNKSDFGKYIEKIMGVETKVNNLMSNLFGDSVEDIKSKNFFSFVTKEEFEKNKIKNEEEFIKIWEEIKNLRNLREEIEEKLKEKVSFKDLESFQTLIHQKIEELFLIQNKKYSHNSTILQILQDQFKKLLELLSQREDQESGNWLITKKPMSGYSCASCDTYLGELKNDQNKFVNWKKMPLKEKEIKEEQFYKVGNGYSRLLQMINFDKDGKMTLNPFANNNNDSNSSVTYKNKSTSSNDLNKPSPKDRVIYSVRNKRDYSKEKNKTIDMSKSINEENISDKKLPIIKPSMSIDNYEKLSGKKNEVNPKIKSRRNNSQY